MDDIATYLKTGSFRGKTTTIGPMAEVIHNSLSYLTDSDLHAVAGYLKSIPADSPLRTGRRLPDPTQAQGAKLYIEQCLQCEESKGRGLPGVFPPLGGNGAVLPSSFDRLQENARVSISSKPLPADVSLPNTPKLN